MRIVQRLLLPLLLLLFSGAPALAQGAVWTVSEARGVVTVIDAQGTRPAKVGTQLAPGATVRTAARASAVLVRGKEFVTMRQNAQLRIAPAQRERGIVQILQDYGSALFNIGKQPNPHFGVDTPYLAAVVKGTTFVITVTNEGASLQVTEGAVETATLDGGAVELIRPGSVAMIAAADPLRMVIEGEGRKVMDSPARAAAPPAAAPAAPAVSRGAEPAAPARAPGRGEASLQSSASLPDTSPRIDQAIVSTPQDFGQVSNGFASGEVVVLAAVMVSDVRGVGNAGGNSGGGPGTGTTGDTGGSPNDDVVCASGTCGAVGGGGSDNGMPPEEAGAGNGNGGGSTGGSDNGNPPQDPGAGTGGSDNGNPPQDPGAGTGGSDNGNPPQDPGAGTGGSDNGNPPQDPGAGNGGSDNGNPPEEAGDGNENGGGNGNGPGADDDGAGGSDNGNPPEDPGADNGDGDDNAPDDPGADNGDGDDNGGGGRGGRGVLTPDLNAISGTLAGRA